MTDPIADLLTRIRNAQTARHESLSVPFSRLKEGIVKILSDEGFVGTYQITDEGGKKEMVIRLRYNADGEPLITALLRKSRPGRRYYLGYDTMKPVRNGMGIAILSTPKGVLTDRQAREQKVGGEVLCTIW